MNTLNNLPMLLTRGPTTLPTTQMGMGFNSTLGVGDGVGATVGDNLMFAAGVGNSSSILQGVSKQTRQLMSFRLI